MERKCLLPIQTPTTISVIGGSSSGKTVWVKRLLEQANLMFNKPPNLIVYCYAVWQDIYSDMQQNISNILFMDSLPTENDLKMWSEQSEKNMVLVMDDMMMDICKSPLMLNLYTTLSHHWGISVINIQQSAYPKGDCNRTISLNTHYFILLSNPRSAHEYKILASQIFPGQAKYFTESFRDAVEGKKFQYLMIDVSPYSDPQYGRLRSGVFPDEVCIVYQPK